MSNYNVYAYWIGADKQSLTNGWSWIDGQPFIFINWAKGEYMTADNQFCAVLTTEFNGQWKTVDCSQLSKYGYICKKNQLGVTRPTTTAFPIIPGVGYGCPIGWYPYKNYYCYKHFDDKFAYKTFNEAKYACKVEGADLLEVSDVAENDHVVGMLAMRSNIVRERNSTARVLDCPYLWTKFGDNCYRAFVNKTVSYSDAQLSCSNSGGFMVSIKSKPENDFIYNFGIYVSI